MSSESWTCKFQLQQGSQEGSALVRLPAEVRNQILNQLLLSDKPLSHLPAEPKDDEHRKISKTYDDDAKLSPNYSFSPAVLATCQTLHQQGSAILYGENELTITVVVRPEIGRSDACYIFDGSVPIQGDWDAFASDFDFFVHGRISRLRCPDQKFTRLSSRRQAIKRFQRLRVVVEARKSGYIDDYEYSSNFRLWFMSNASLYLRILVSGKDVVLVPIAARPLPEPRKPWKLDDLFMYRWWRCKSLVIQRAGLDQEVAKHIEDVVTASDPANWKDLVIRFLELDSHIRSIDTETPLPICRHEEVCGIMHRLAQAAVRYDDEAFEDLQHSLVKAIRIAHLIWVDAQQRMIASNTAIVDDHLDHIIVNHRDDEESLYRTCKRTSL